VTLDDLKRLPQWVAHKRKIPISPKNGRAASSTDPATWDVATRAWSAKTRYGLDGIGYVFTVASGVVGVDIDHCIEDGELTDAAYQLVSAFDSYTEISPSGTGLHIFVTGTIPHSIKTPEIEIYNEMRYFTVTGNRVRHTRHEIMPRQAELDAVFVTFGGSFDDDPLPDLRGKENGRRHNGQRVTEQRVRDILARMPTHGDYNSYWLPILMAVHSEFPDERGVQLIEAWSPGTRGEVRRKFRSFDRTAKNGISIGTLFHMAQDHNAIPRRAMKRKTGRHQYDLRDAL
jgi:hypothetical protein